MTLDKFLMSLRISTRVIGYDLRHSRLESLRIIGSRIIGLICGK